MEECDGGDLGDSTCAGRGYASGTLACSSTYTVDQSGCSDCMPIGGRVASCGPAPITFPYLATFAMASTDTEVGVGQVDYNPNTSESRLTFMRLDTRLGLISVVGVEDTSQPGPLQGVFIDTVAVAATPSGWLVAACGGGNVFVNALDATGKKIARTVLSDSSAKKSSGRW